MESQQSMMGRCLMSAPKNLVTLSECIYRVAAHTKEWPDYSKARMFVLNAALDGRLTIYGAPRFLSQHEPVPAHVFSKPLYLPSLELLSLVKSPNPKRFGDWETGMNDDKLGTLWRRLCVIETQIQALTSSLKVKRKRNVNAKVRGANTITKSGGDNAREEP